MVYVIDMMKFNAELRQLTFPIFGYQNIKFTEKFDSESPTVTEEYIRIDNPFHYNINHSEWVVFKQILKKFEEKQKDLNKEKD